MAATDLIQVQREYTDPVTSVKTTGVVEKLPVSQALAGVAPAAAPVPFADLTAAANSFNALRTALITAGLLK